MSQNSISIASGHYRVGLLRTLFVQMFFFLVLNLSADMLNVKYLC